MRYCLFLLLIITLTGYGQKNEMIDSLREAQKNTKSDSIKIEIAYKIAEITNNFKLRFWDSIAQESSIRNLKKLSSAAYNNIGYILQSSGNTDSSIVYFHKSLEIKKEIQDSAGMIQLLNNIGVFYDTKGDLLKALEYYTQSLKISEQLKDIKGQAESWNNLGFIQLGQKDTTLALDYFRKALSLNKKVNRDVGIATSLNNIAYIYRKRGDFQEAISLYRKGLALYQQSGDYWGVSMSYSNIGGVNADMNELDTAIFYFNRAKSLQEQYQDNYGLAYSYINIGSAYWLKGHHNIALENTVKGYELAKNMQIPEMTKKAVQTLYKIYEQKNDWENAYKYHMEFTTLSDSLTNIENQQAVIEQRTRYQYDKQKALDDAAHEKQLAVEKEKQEAQFKIILLVVSSGGIVLILLLIIYRRLQLAKRQKAIIEEQKEEVEAQRDEIDHQKKQVEEAHSEIKDSINYAKRIQGAILPSDALLRELLPQSFILYLPKDVVAGDFYWIEQKENLTLFAAADCTGHGVPGAMVSVVCHNAMNRAVREFDLDKPGLILDKTREIVEEELSKKNQDPNNGVTEIKDGMDIALCSLKTENGKKKLEYAGAHNPLWVIKNNELIEIKADKQPVGSFDHSIPFRTHTLEVAKGDLIYIFSDGFADQFGGPLNKKYGSRNLKKLLLEVSSMDLDKQKSVLHKCFVEWKNQSYDEQLDDVCIMGVKI